MFSLGQHQPMEATMPSSNQTMFSLLKRWLPLIALVLVVAALYFTGSYKWLSIEALVQNYNGMSQFVADYLVFAVLIYMALYIVAVALSFPAAWVLTVSGGLLLGWWVAGFATIFAATIGASILFFIAKTSIGEHMRQNAKGYVQRMRDGFQKDALNYMLFLRLTPVFPFTLVNIVPGILGVPFAIFFWTTLVALRRVRLPMHLLAKGWIRLLGRKPMPMKRA